MRERVVWLSFWITLTYWLGNAFGCATAPSAVVHYAPDDGLLGGGTTAEPVRGIDEKVGEYPIDTTATLMDEYGIKSMAKPSLTGFDRSHWQPVPLRAVSGETLHHPIYFHDVDPCYVDPAGENFDMTVAGALAGATAEDYSKCNLRDTFVQPAKGFLDVGLLPVRMVIQVPWSVQSTP